MSQTEIKPGPAKVLGVVEDYPGRLCVEIPLSPRPDHVWTAIFNRGPAVGFPAALHEPHIVGGRAVRVQPPDDELEKFIDAVFARIESTNRYYAEHVEPPMRAKQKAAERELAERRRRIQEAQRKLDDGGSKK
jgi:hypothetical protein